MNITFDDLDSAPIDSQAAKPFVSVLNDTEEKRLKWFQAALEFLRKQGIKRTTSQRVNLAAYRGLNWGNITTRNNITRDRQGLPLNKVERFKANFLFNLTETKVSQLSKIKPAVQVLPNSNEFQDKTAARATKKLLDHTFAQNNLDYLLQQHQRYKKIFGESYLFIEWDKNKGDIVPDFEENMPLLNEHGEPELDENGEPIIITRPPRMGDVCFSIEAPWRVLLQRKKRFEEVEYAFRLKIYSVDELRLEYPECAEEIKADNSANIFDMEDLQDKRLEDEVLVWEFFHKDTQHVPGGYYAKFFNKKILEEGPLPYSHGDLPFDRITDIDLPDVLNGVSIYDIVMPMQNMHDNLTTLIAKNIWLCGHAKWMMPRGAAKIEALGNDNTIVQYQGPVAPQLVQSQQNSPEVYKYRDQLRVEMGELFGVHPVSTGNPPTGVTAAVALQFLNEQESERASSEIAKHNMAVENIAKKTLAVMGDFYDYDDERLVKILGKDNEYQIKYFDMANLEKAYDVKVNISTALPDSKAGRTERIFQAMQYNREMLPPERWAELLELGAVDKMNSLITESIKAAESENEDLVEGVDVAPPEEWEEHIQHWHAHVKRLQSRSFKEELEPDFRAAFIEHIKAHEYLMTEKAKANPKFSAELAQLSQFPLFYSDPSFQPQSAPQQEAVIQGEANRGEELTGQIPDMNSPQLGANENE